MCNYWPGNSNIVEPNIKILNWKCCKIQDFLRAEMIWYLEISMPDLLWQVTVQMQAHYKYCIELPAGSVCSVSMIHTWISCFGFGFHPEGISLGICKIPKSETFRIPSILGKEQLVCYTAGDDEWTGEGMLAHDFWKRVVGGSDIRQMCTGAGDKVGWTKILWVLKKT